MTFSSCGKWLAICPNMDQHWTQSVGISEGEKDSRAFLNVINRLCSNVRLKSFLHLNPPIVIKKSVYEAAREFLQNANLACNFLVIFKCRFLTYSRYKFLLCLFFYYSLGACEKQIALMVRSEYKGELSLAYRLQAACRNLEWNADILLMEQSEINLEKQYDFAINLVPQIYKYPRCKNYLAVYHPKFYFFKKNGALKKEYRTYDGYLVIFEPSTSGHKKGLANSQKFPHIRWLPTAQKRLYQIVSPTHLFFICCSWGDRFEEQKFQQLLKFLDKESYTRFYGNSKFKSLFPQSYQGVIPYDEESLLRRAEESGVSLVLHSKEHNAQGVPSGRIFEAAAASTVIICDRNNFVLEHFRDSVLYIDTEQDSSSILSQIQNHMKWIQENKSDAIEKAQKAHSIYLENFSLEDQLLKLEKFHNQIAAPPIPPPWTW